MPLTNRKQKFLENGAIVFLGALLFTAIAVLLIGTAAFALWVF